MTMDGLALTRFVSDCVTCIENAGLKIEFGTDFKRLRRETARQNLRGMLAPMFDEDCGHVQPGNSFWVTVADSNGELVATEALVLVELGEQSLSSHLHENLEWYRPPGNKVDCARSTVSLSSAASLCGRVCYNGEMWIKGGPDGYRGSPLIALVPRAAMAMAFVKWMPDHIFALVEPGSAIKGLTARAGFVHLEQGSIDWQYRRKAETFAEWVTWLSASDARHLVTLGPKRLCDMLGGWPVVPVEKDAERLTA